MPPVMVLCCPYCMDKSTLLANGENSTGNGELKHRMYHTKGLGYLDHFYCSLCDSEYDRTELKTVDTGMVTVAFIDPVTGEERVRRIKAGARKKPTGNAYWKKQNRLLKRLRRG